MRPIVMADIIGQLTDISLAPSDPVAFQQWLAPDAPLHFLRENAKDEEIVVYASLDHIFIHAVTIPTALVTPPDPKELLDWNYGPQGGWGITFGFHPPSVWLSAPLDNAGSETVSSGEPLVFMRSFQGRIGEREDKSYFEVLQKLLHVFDLHFLEERQAYCRLDKHGDIEDVIRMVQVPPTRQVHRGRVITFRRELLDDWMALTDCVALRMFDFTKTGSDFGSWAKAVALDVAPADPGFAYRGAIDFGRASYLRGSQILQPGRTRQSLARSFDESQERLYESFIALDLKDRNVKEISTAPGRTANYFTKSDLPFEMSPVFFRPEVLAKYKADTDKYRFEARSISCRATWHLQTYDINEAGQVHTYIVYLRRLPDDEQLHWKAYNEAPKGTISKRAITTDFQGQWDTDYDPLPSLKSALEDLRQDAVDWWTLRSEHLMEQVHYPVTASADEWANDLLNLDKLVVEGFETMRLRQMAVDLGRAPDSKFASLRLLRECLMGVGLGEDEARRVLEPLVTLHNLRSKMKGHADGAEATQIKRETLIAHRSFPRHFRALCASCDESVRAIAKALKR